VYRSLHHVYAQLIDDTAGATLAAASTVDLKTGRKDTEAAAAVGRAIADRAKEAGVTTAVFDRGGFLYHGRVKALADAAREAGLDF
jgi:large subunit ribosomal protein L18